MKENNKQVVFYSAEKMDSLKVTRTKEVQCLQQCLLTVWERRYSCRLNRTKNKNELDKLAEAFGCEVLIVEAEYNVTKLDGSDFERTEREESTKDGIKALLEFLAK